eukprot:GEMP01047129.1.p1 GENE.GEMP01047129.1~~GEMP01047129.1.p1  ORF type:complete len:438 (+),score=98.32 GEMP01047129.1:388-1701(+)
MPIPFVVVAADVAGLTLLARALNSSSSSLTKFVLRLCCAEHREVVVARKKRKADTQKGINATNGDRIASEGPSERRSKRKKETVSRNTVSVAPIVAADATGGKRLRPESVEVLQRPMKDTRNDESPSPLNSLTPPRGEAIVAETISMPKFFAINSPQLVKVSEPCTGQKYAGPIIHGEYDDAASLCGSSHSLEDAYDIDFALVSNTLSTQEPSDDDCTLCAMDQQKQDTIEAARNNSMSVALESIAGKLNEEDSAAEPPETTGEEGKRAAEHPETIAGYKEEDKKRDDAFEHPEIMSEDGYHAAQVTDANVDEEFATHVPKENTCVAQWSEQSFHKNDTVSLQAESNPDAVHLASRYPPMWIFIPGVCFIVLFLSQLKYQDILSWRPTNLGVMVVNCLMFIAIIGALLNEEYVEAGAIVFLRSVGEWLQTSTTEHTR